LWHRRESRRQTEKTNMFLQPWKAPAYSKAGNSPFHVTIKPERGIRNLFRRGKRRNPSMVGGQAFECPEGHTLISMITWRT
jgi:hypothetical protein